MWRITKRIMLFILSLSLLFSSTCVVLANEMKEETQSIQEEKENIVNNLTMTEKQLSAISMLNYLTVLSQEINASSNSKLYLDNAYSSIVNNINPNAVDSDSMYQIRTLLNTINAYQSILTKRERLQYIYQQNQAKAIQEAIPNPMSVLNVVEATNPAKALIAVVYMAVDSKSSYDAYVSEVENKYMQDGWELDDEATENLHESRSEAFEYMVEMCNKNGLDGKLALNEDAVRDFVKWESEPNVVRRIDFFEKTQNTYKAYGKYWLVLAESYYEVGDYQKCLNCINKYEKMNIVTFRKDCDFAKTLTVGLAAANEEKKGVFYIRTAEHFLNLILGNIENDDWALRYVAAETYIDLYAKTNNEVYLETAYKLAEENVNYLIDEQYSKNATYLADIEKQVAKKTDTDSVKKEIKNYNKWIEEERKVELPPVYEPLVVNCELLFGLAEELNVSASAKKKVDTMLHAEDKPLFLTAQLENEFWFNSVQQFVPAEISFEGDKIIIPANLLAQGTKIKATITRDKESTLFEDWTLEKVDRGKEITVEKFDAVYKSNSIKRYDFKNGDIIKIEIIPSENSPYEKIEYSYKASVQKKLKVLSDVTFKLENVK